MDLLVEADEPPGLLDRARIKLALEASLGLPVDNVAIGRHEELTPFERIARARARPLEATGTNRRGTDPIMRLDEWQARRIREAAERHFGAGTRVWLFGSRVDDTAKGGDIDLYIEPALSSPDELVDAKLALLAELHRCLGEQKIDIVIRRPGAAEELPIHHVARETGIRL